MVIKELDCGYTTINTHIKGLFSNNRNPCKMKFFARDFQKSNKTFLK